MDKQTTEKDIERTSRIENQVERWDLFAKLAPTIFLLVCILLLVVGSVSFETVFTIGMILFSLTAVTWWFWTIYSIRFLVKTLNRASSGLIEVTDDLVEAKRELKEYVRLEEDNNSKCD
jgi:ABC-type transport system involved in Fe-S cluster assembly fused permease/ATPase subunit